MDYETDDYELLYLVSEENEEAKDIFYKKYSKSCEVYAKKYYPLVKSSGVELNDLIQEGMLGFTNAIKSYDENKNIKFTTFANTCIERHILTFVRSNTRDKHKALNESLSMDSTTNSCGISLKDLIEDEKSLNPEESFFNKESKKYFDTSIIDRLTELEKNAYLLKLEGFKYDEIASRLNVSKKSVERAIYRAKNKIKNISKVIDE